MLASPSIIIEWETGRECPRDRVVASLAEVARQLRELCPVFAAPPETIVCAEAAWTSESEIRAIFARATDGGDWPGLLRVVIAARRIDYYQQKNLGFEYSRNDIIVFMDSDLVPEPDWLVNLIGTFADYRKAVVMGRTHLVTRTLYERAVALSWIFDTRTSDITPQPTQRLMSNNIAFRRALFARFPFPDAPTFRGQCSQLGNALAAAGIRMYECPAARASHPAHHGARAFMLRALHAGSDRHWTLSQGGLVNTRTCISQWRKDLANVNTRVAERRDAICANALDVVAARILGFIYYGLKALGYLAARARGSAAPDAFMSHRE